MGFVFLSSINRKPCSEAFILNVLLISSLADPERISYGLFQVALGHLTNSSNLENLFKILSCWYIWVLFGFDLEIA